MGDKGECAIPVLTIQDDNPTFLSGLESGTGNVINFLNVFSGITGVPTSVNESVIEVTSSGFVYRLEGLNLDANGTHLTSGTLNAIHVYKVNMVNDDQGALSDPTDDVLVPERELVYSMAGLGLTGTQTKMAAAMPSKQWTINGTGGGDIYTSTLLPSSSTVINTWNLNDGHDRFNGNASNERVSGGKVRDTIYGDAGNDVLKGHGDADTLLGGTCSDRIYTGSQTSELVMNLASGGSGNDLVDGGGDDDVLQGALLHNLA